MEHTHRWGAVVRPWLFDAEVLEVLGKIRRAGGCEELGDGELEGVGEFFQIIHADVTFTEELMPRVQDAQERRSLGRARSG